jgi:hypothetical protein
VKILPRKHGFWNWMWRDYWLNMRKCVA